VRAKKRCHHQAQAQVQRQQQVSTEAGGFDGGNKISGALQALLRMQPAGEDLTTGDVVAVDADNGLIKQCDFPVLNGLLQAES